MRVAVFSNTYRPTVSGVVSSMILFRQGLIECGHQVHIFAPEHDGFEDDEPYVFRIPALNIPGEIDLSLALPFKAPLEITMQGIKPDLIHSQHPILVGDLAAAFSIDMDLPLVFTFHSQYDAYAQRYVPVAPNLASSVVDDIVGRYLERCTHIIAPTPGVRDMILDNYSLKVPVTVIPSPVNLNAYSSLEPERIRGTLDLRDSELLLYAGRLAKMKNLGFLLRAFSTITSARPRTRLLLLGDGPFKDKLEQLAKELGLQNRVLFPGSVPHDQVPHYMAAADLFVFPSPTETQGLVLVESMAAGTPVVAIESPSSAEVVDLGGGVLALAEEDLFADAVMALLQERDRRFEMGRQARRVAKRYTIPATTEQLLSVYEAATMAGPATRN